MITVSIVSHGHGDMTSNVLGRILACPEVSKVILTCNIPEPISETKKDRTLFINNPLPRGFGANHNIAFRYCATEYFCVVNPDIEFSQNPFPNLINEMELCISEIAAPLVLSANGDIEDSARYFPTLGGLLIKLLGGRDGSYKITQDQSPFEPDWIAGMFMIFKSSAFVQLGGFDEGYFLYYEDVDICRRAHQLGLKIICCPKTSVIHNAQRASRTNFRHMRWHLASMCRYLIKFSK